MKRTLIKYFVQGLILIGPVAITLFVIYKIFLLIDGSVNSLLGVDFPGLGLLVMIPSIALIGYLGSSIIFAPIKNYFAKLLDRAPLIKTIYSSVKDLLSAFVGQKKKFNQAVMVKLNAENELYRLGYLTVEDLSALNMSDEMVGVYLPHSYNFSGNFYLVPKKNVTPVNMPSGDLMKFVVSGGVTSIHGEE